MDLVDEQYGAPALALRDLGGHYGFAYVFYTTQNRGHGQELGIETISHQSGKRGLAHTRRPPEHHRMRPPGIKRYFQGIAGHQQMSPPHHLSPYSGPHAPGQ